jgi:hypothetical protein
LRIYEYQVHIILSGFFFLSLHVRMFRCKQHNVYPSQHITRTVSTTVYGIYVFWLQGIYTRKSFASTWFHPRLVGGVGVVHLFSLSSVVCFCFVCLRSVCCVPNVTSFFWTVPSVFSTVYLLPKLFHVSYVPNVPSISEYFILDCPFGVL